MEFSCKFLPHEIDPRFAFQVFDSTTTACPIDNLNAACDLASTYNPSLIVTISNSGFTVRDSCVSNTTLFNVQILNVPGSSSKPNAKVSQT